MFFLEEVRPLEAIKEIQREELTNHKSKRETKVLAKASNK